MTSRPEGGGAFPAHFSGSLGSNPALGSEVDPSGYPELNLNRGMWDGTTQSPNHALSEGHLGTSAPAPGGPGASVGGAGAGVGMSRVPAGMAQGMGGVAQGMGPMGMGMGPMGMGMGPMSMGMGHMGMGLMGMPAHNGAGHIAGAVSNGVGGDMNATDPAGVSGGVAGHSHMGSMGMAPMAAAMGMGSMGMGSGMGMGAGMGPIPHGMLPMSAGQINPMATMNPLGMNMAGMGGPMGMDVGPMGPMYGPLGMMGMAGMFSANNAGGASGSGSSNGGNIGQLSKENNRGKGTSNDEADPEAVDEDATTAMANMNPEDAESDDGNNNGTGNDAFNPIMDETGAMSPQQLQKQFHQMQIAQMQQMYQMMQQFRQMQQMQNMNGAAAQMGPGGMFRNNNANSNNNNNNSSGSGSSNNNSNNSNPSIGGATMPSFMVNGLNTAMGGMGMTNSAESLSGVGSLGSLGSTASSSVPGASNARMSGLGGLSGMSGMSNLSGLNGMSNITPMSGMTSGTSEMRTSGSTGDLSSLTSNLGGNLSNLTSSLTGSGPGGGLGALSYAGAVKSGMDGFGELSMRGLSDPLSKGAFDFGLTRMDSHTSTTNVDSDNTTSGLSSIWANSATSALSSSRGFNLNPTQEVDIGQLVMQLDEGVMTPEISRALSNISLEKREKLLTSSLGALFVQGLTRALTSQAARVKFAATIPSWALLLTKYLFRSSEAVKGALDTAHIQEELKGNVDGPHLSRIPRAKNAKTRDQFERDLAKFFENESWSRLITDFVLPIVYQDTNVASRVEAVLSNLTVTVEHCVKALNENLFPTRRMRVHQMLVLTASEAFEQGMRKADVDMMVERFREFCQDGLAILATLRAMKAIHKLEAINRIAYWAEMNAPTASLGQILKNSQIMELMTCSSPTPLPDGTSPVETHGISFTGDLERFGRELELESAESRVMPSGKEMQSSTATAPTAGCATNAESKSAAPVSVTRKVDSKAVNSTSAQHEGSTKPSKEAFEKKREKKVEATKSAAHAGGGTVQASRAAVASPKESEAARAPEEEDVAASTQVAKGNGKKPAASAGVAAAATTLESKDNKHEAEKAKSTEVQAISGEDPERENEKEREKERGHPVYPGRSPPGKASAIETWQLHVCTNKNCKSDIYGIHLYRTCMKVLRPGAMAKFESRLASDLAPFGLDASMDDKVIIKEMRNRATQERLALQQQKAASKAAKA